ncbi:MAG: hypothetical protein ACXV5H_01315 [Halobacteriota archaeon]
MPAAKNDRIDVLIQEVRELKSEIKELRILLMYELLKKEDRRVRSGDSLLELTKQALNGAVEQLADLERKPGVQTRAEKRSTAEPTKARKGAPMPMVDVDKEIAILKKEMATSLRNAAREIEEEGADEEKEDTE